MSKRFQDFLNQSESKTPSEEEPDGIQVDAGLGCQVCFQQTDEPAIWSPAKKTLKWKCPNGHDNIIKDFKGF